LLLTLWQVSALTIMLCALGHQETRPEKHRMLAVLLPQRIHGLVQIREPLYADCFPKEIELTVIGLRELAQDHPGRAVRGRRIEEVLEGLRHSAENVIGKLRGARESHLKPPVAKLLGAQENHHALGGELVFPRFDASVLDVLGQLRQDKGPIARRWR